MTDSIIGTPDADTLAGTEADDFIAGGGDNDTIDGGAGNDSIRGDGDSDGGTVEIRDFIVNGSFEDVADGSGSPTMLDTFNSNGDDVHDRTEVGFYEAVPGWQTSGENIEIHGDWTGIDNSPAALDGNFKLEIDGGGTDPFFNNKNVFQDVEGLLDGESYTLNFSLLNRDGDYGDVVKVYFGGEKIATIEQTSTDWCEYEFEVAGGAGDGCDQLEFKIWTYDEHAIFIDSVSLVGPANVAVEDVPGDDVIAGGAGEDTIDGEEGNDFVDGGEGADLIDGGEGNDTLNGGADGEGSGSSGGEEFCAENGIAGFDAVGVSLSGTDFDGSAATVTDASHGIGVAGGSPVGDQINHASSGETQTLTADFGQNVDSATVTVTHFFPDEGNGGETGQWRALDADGVEVATGTFGPDDVITDHDLGDIPAVGRFTIDGIGEFASIELSALPYADGDDVGGSDSSDYFLYSIKFTTSVVVDDCGDGDSDTIHGGLGDDEINGNGGDDALFGDDGNDLIDGGAGNDVIDGGAGNDTITGDSGTSSEGVEQITIPQGENGLYDVAGRDSITLTMDFLGGEASFNNSFGFYLADESGTPISGEVVKADVKTSDAGEGADVLTFTLNAAQLGGAAQLGLFLIPNGGSLNPDLADGDAVTFADNGYGELQALVDGTPVVAAGGHGPVFFSDASLNGDGVDHESDSELAGNSNWEDLENGGDNDFDDVNWQVDVTTTEGCETGHDDTINGGEGHDSISGNDGDDSLTGDIGCDTLSGGDGDDILAGNAGADVMDGGAGIDTADYSAAQGTVLVSLNDGIAEKDGDGWIDSLANIENLTGSDHNDSLLGDDGANVILGGDGDDTIDGFGGADTMDGGAGNNTVSFQSADGGVLIALQNNLALDADGLDIALTGFNSAIGSDFDDRITGNDADNTLIGGGGNDDIRGNDGADLMYGDGVTQSFGDTDTLIVHAHGSPLDGVFPVMEVSVGGVVVGTAQVTQSLSPYDFDISGLTEAQRAGEVKISFLNDATDGGDCDNSFGPDGNEDRNLFVEAIEFNGALTDASAGELSFEPDQFVSYQSGGANFAVEDIKKEINDSGTDRPNGGNVYTGFVVFAGLPTEAPFDGPNSDFVIGNDGNDTQFGGFDNDTVFGGQGDDCLFGGDGDDLVCAFEDDDEVYGGAGNDFVEGNSGNDSVFGGDGDDKVAGNDGTDTVFGDDGSDDVDGGAGDDFVFGGLGADSVGGGDGNDVVHGDEDDDTVRGNNGDDTLFGDGGADSLLGEDGNDLIFGGVGNDTAKGDAGDDTLVGDAGADFLDGGDGADSLVGGEGNDILRGRADSDVLDGGVGSDVVKGDAGNDVVSGGDGDDQVEGGDGDDTVDGGDGVDKVLGDAGNDVVSGGAGDDTVRGNAGNDTLLGGLGADFMEGGTEDDRVEGGEGNDTMRGDGGQDELFGDAGEDVLRGGDGNDTMHGGLDSDFMVSDNGDDVLFGDEGADSLRGGDGDDTLTGGEGDDNLRGNLGNDQLDGGIGNDFMDGEDGDDALFGGLGDDVLRGNDGEDTIEGGEGVDRIRGGLNGDDLFGGGGDDFINADGGRDFVDGGDGDDELFGAGGDDTLLGGAGNDRVRGQDGADSMDGGAGDDFMTGDNGDDFMAGGDGNDDLRGNVGFDTLFGGNGSDTLIGGNGQKDTYLFGRRTDLEANDDTIDDSGAGNTLNIFGVDDLGELAFTDLGDGIVNVSFNDGSGSITFDADAVTELNLLDALGGTVTTATTLLNNGVAGIDLLDDESNLLFTI